MSGAAEVRREPECGTAAWGRLGVAPRSQGRRGRWAPARLGAAWAVGPDGVRGGVGGRPRQGQGEPKRLRSNAFTSNRGVRPITSAATRSAVTADSVRPICWWPSA